MEPPRPQVENTYSKMRRLAGSIDPEPGAPKAQELQNFLLGLTSDEWRALAHIFPHDKFAVSGRSLSPYTVVIVELLALWKSPHEAKGAAPTNPLHPHSNLVKLVERMSQGDLSVLNDLDEMRFYAWKSGFDLSRATPLAKTLCGVLQKFNLKTYDTLRKVKPAHANEVNTALFIQGQFRQLKDVQHTEATLGGTIRHVTNIVDECDIGRIGENCKSYFDIVQELGQIKTDKAGGKMCLSIQLSVMSLSLEQVMRFQQTPYQTTTCLQELKASLDRLAVSSRLADNSAIIIQNCDAIKHIAEAALSKPAQAAQDETEWEHHLVECTVDTGFHVARILYGQRRETSPYTPVARASAGSTS
ncbi:hypothetical protein JCM16303_005419 [Sporobolomyces ruberrimus]